MTIIENLRGSYSAEVLQLHIDDASTISKGALEDLRRFHTSAPEDKDVDAATKAIVLDAASTAMLRIYGYFMFRKFNREPSVTSRRDIGTMRLDFISHTEVATEVAVTNTIPFRGDDFSHLIRFAFLYTAKLLGNFPDENGRRVAKHAHERLYQVNDHFPLKYNESMLGICSERLIKIRHCSVTIPEKRLLWDITYC